MTTNNTTPQPLTREYEANLRTYARNGQALTPQDVTRLFDALDEARATANGDAQRAAAMQRERDEARAVCEMLASPDANPAVMVAAARTEAQRLVALYTTDVADLEAERDAARAEAERLRAELAEAREMACADGECGKCHYCTDAVAWNGNLRAANAELRLAQAQADDFAAQRDRACAALARMREALKACRRAMQNDWHNKPRIGMERECALAEAALSSPPDEWLATKLDEARREQAETDTAGWIALLRSEEPMPVPPELAAALRARDAAVLEEFVARLRCIHDSNEHHVCNCSCESLRALAARGGRR